MIVRMVHNRRTAVSLSRRAHAPLLHLYTNPIIPHLAVLAWLRRSPRCQLRQRRRQILRVHLLIRRLLIPHLPTRRRARRRADEEQLVALRRLQVLVLGL